MACLFLDMHGGKITKLAMFSSGIIKTSHGFASIGGF